MSTVGTEIPILETTNKTVADAINEIHKKQSQFSSPDLSDYYKKEEIENKIDEWDTVGTRIERTIKYNFIKNKRYRIYYNYVATSKKENCSFLFKEFIYGGHFDFQYLDFAILNNKIHVYIMLKDDFITMSNDPSYPQMGQLWKLEEMQ